MDSCLLAQSATNRNAHANEYVVATREKTAVLFPCVIYIAYIMHNAYCNDLLLAT